MNWTPLDPAAPPATSYGKVIDYLYAVNGQPGELGRNVARRSGWSRDEFIYADEFAEEELDALRLPYGVFFGESGEEYTSPTEDVTATDWLVGRLEDE